VISRISIKEREMEAVFKQNHRSSALRTRFGLAQMTCCDPVWPPIERHSALLHQGGFALAYLAVRKREGQMKISRWSSAFRNACRLRDDRQLSNFVRFAPHPPHAASKEVRSFRSNLRMLLFLNRCCLVPLAHLIPLS